MQRCLAFTNEDIEHEDDCEEKVYNHDHLEGPIVKVQIISDGIVSASLFVVSLRWEGVKQFSYMRQEGKQWQVYNHGSPRIKIKSTCHEKIGCREGIKEVCWHLYLATACLCIFDGARVEHVEDGDCEGGKPRKEYDEKGTDAADDPTDNDNEMADRFEYS